MSLWFDAKRKEYASDGKSNWIKRYCDNAIDELKTLVTAHFLGQSDRHKASHIDYTDSRTVEDMIDDLSEADTNETAARTAADSELLDHIERTNVVKAEMSPNSLCLTAENGDDIDVILTGKLTTEMLADGAVKSAKIANDVNEDIDGSFSDVTRSSTLNSAIFTTNDGNEIELNIDPVDGSITTAKLADGAVTTVKIADEAVTTAKIADGAVTTDKIGFEAVNFETLDITAEQKHPLEFDGLKGCTPVGYGKQNWGDVSEWGSYTIYAITYDDDTKTDEVGTGFLIATYSYLSESGDITKGIRQVYIECDGKKYYRIGKGTSIENTVWDDWTLVSAPASDIPDSIVTTAKLADDAVALIDTKADKVAANNGFVAGDGASVGTTAGGVAIGEGASTDYSGGAIGYKTTAHSGFSGGQMATATGNGAAVGANTSVHHGGAVGYGASAQNGFAGGKDAKCASNTDCIQLGEGTNETAKTLKVYDYTLMNADGTIPSTAMPDAIIGISFDGSGLTFTKNDGTGIDVPISGITLPDGSVTEAKLSEDLKADIVTGLEITTGVGIFQDDGTVSEGSKYLSVTPLDGSTAIGEGIELTDLVPEGSITSDKLADGAVTEDQIGNSCVATEKIASEAVTTVCIADGAVTTAKLADASVGNAQLADDAVDTAQLCNNSIVTEHIADGQVTAAKLADDVTGNTIKAYASGDQTIEGVLMTLENTLTNLQTTVDKLAERVTALENANTTTE